MSAGTAMTHRDAEPKFPALLDDAKKRIAAVLPPDVKPERFAQTVLSAYNRTPELQACSARSVVQALIKAAEIGLTPNSALGHAYLVPFNNKAKVNGKDVWSKEAQLVIGYKGYIHLACRSGFFRAVDARTVKMSDRFTLMFNPRPVFEHVPYFGADAGPTILVYAYGVTRDGEVVLEAMTREEVEKVRAAAPSKESPAWRNWWEEMAKKTAVKRLLKDQPCGDLMALALDADDAAEAAYVPAPGAGAALSGTSRAEALAARLEGPAPAPTDDELYDDIAASEGGRDDE